MANILIFLGCALCSANVGTCAHSPRACDGNQGPRAGPHQVSRLGRYNETCILGFFSLSLVCFFAPGGKSMKSTTLSSSVPKCLWTLKRPPARRATPPCLRPSSRRSMCDHKTALRAPSVTSTAALVRHDHTR